MGWTNSQFDGELVIPNGATTGQRITINVGNDGAIKVYDSANVLIAEISPTADVIKVYNADGSWAQLSPSLPNDVSFSDAPGLALSRPSGDAEPATLTQYDDTFDHGLYVRSSSPVVNGVPGTDFAVIQMIGRYSTSSQILLQADGPGSTISLNSTTFDQNGEMAAYAGGNVRSFNPAIGNAGTAVFNRSGWYIRFGPWIFFNADLTVTTAGSGAGILRLVGPTSVDRTQRQVIHGYGSGLTAGNSGVHNVIANTAGSGSTWDLIRNSQGANITGADLLLGAQITYQGWFLE